MIMLAVLLLVYLGWLFVLTVRIEKAKESFAKQIGEGITKRIIFENPLLIKKIIVRKDAK